MRRATVKGLAIAAMIYMRDSGACFFRASQSARRVCEANCLDLTVPRSHEGGIR
jgi:hypothetical protein